MRGIHFFAAYFAVACGNGFSQPCTVSQIDSAASAIQVLDRLAPTTEDPAAKKCIRSAINVTSQFRSAEAIPQLIRYLSFKRDKESWEGSIVQMHPPVEGDDYPAVVSLARIGEPARPALVQTIESEKSSPIELNNAAHAIVLSFTHEPERDPGKGIIYLRHAEATAGPATRQRLEQAVSYIMTTESCRRFLTKCADARQSTLH